MRGPAGSRNYVALVNKNRPQQRREQPAESRASEVLTVTWMMAVVTTLICAVVSALVRGVGSGNDSALLFSRLLHFGALVTAVGSLVLLGLVLKVRTVRPPLPVTWFSLAVALLVILAAFFY